MGTLCAECLDMAASIHKEDFGTLDALDLDLLLGAGGDGQGVDAFELIVLGGHGGCVREATSWDGKASRW